MLNQIEHNSGSARLNALMRQFYPRFERLSTHVSGGTVQLYLHESGFATPISATRLSNGTIRFITLLAALLAPNPPPLLCIEEPELGLHPDSLTLLGELLVEASDRTQLIVTTHSDALVSALTNHVDTVVARERLSDGTSLRGSCSAKQTLSSNSESTERSLYSLSPHPLRTAASCVSLAPTCLSETCSHTCAKDIHWTASSSTVRALRRRRSSPSAGPPPKLQRDYGLPEQRMS